MAHPHDELLAEIKREIATRQRVYPGWVRDGKITADLASLRLELMRRVLAFLVERDPRLAGNEQADLFEHTPPPHRDPTA